MKISVITPSYNQGAFLEETILSVISQKGVDLEFIIIDGGSSDNSIDIIKKYERNISYWISEKDNGQSHAINKGFKIATGEIVTWLCSDDVYFPDTLKKVINTFTSLPEDTVLVHGNTEIFNSKRIIRVDKGNKQLPHERFLAGMAFSQPSAFFRINALHKVGLLEETLHFGMDYDLFARLALTGKFYFVNDLFSRYRLHEASKSVAFQQKFIRDWLWVFLRVLATLNLRREMSEVKGLFNYITLPDTTPYPIVQIKNNFEKYSLIYYFLSNILRQDYILGNFNQCKKLIEAIEEKFPDYSKKDEMITPIIRRMRFPGPAGINLLRTLRNHISFYKK